MSYVRNAATPKPISVGRVTLIADGTPVVTGASVRVQLDAGGWGAGGGTLAYDATSETTTYAPTQAETNGDVLQISVYKASCIGCQVTVMMDPVDLAVNATKIGGQTASAAGTVTFPGTIGTSTLTQTQVTGGAYDVTNASCIVHASGNWYTGTPPTTGQIVTAMQDTGTQLKALYDLRPAYTILVSAAGYVTYVNAAPPTVGAIATAVWQDTTGTDFTTAGSIGKSLFTSGAVPGAASGISIVGSLMTPSAAVIAGAVLDEAVGAHTGLITLLVRSTTPANTLTVDTGHLVAVPDTQKVKVASYDTNQGPLYLVTGGAYALAVDANGLAGTNVIKFGGTTVTGRDIGLNVLITPGTGTGQLSVTSGVVAASGNWNTTTPPTVGAIATAIWQDTTGTDFTTSGSIGKSLFTSGAVPGAASGLSIVGSLMTVGAVTLSPKPNEYFVSKNGDNGNSGTTPWLSKLTATAAIGNMVSGQRLNVEAGAFAENLDASGLNVLTVTGAGKDVTTITGTFKGGAVCRMRDLSRNMVNAGAGDELISGGTYAQTLYVDDVKAQGDVDVLHFGAGYAKTVFLNAVELRSCYDIINVYGSTSGGVKHLIEISDSLLVSDAATQAALVPAGLGYDPPARCIKAFDNVTIRIRRSALVGLNALATAYLDEPTGALTQCIHIKAGARVELLEGTTLFSNSATGTVKDIIIDAASGGLPAGILVIDNSICLDMTKVTNNGTILYAPAVADPSAAGVTAIQTGVEREGGMLDVLDDRVPNIPAVAGEAATAVTGLALTTDVTSAVSAIEVYGQAHWVTATGFATPTNITAATGISLASSQHVIVDSGVVTSLTTWDKSGYALSATGLDAISTTAPTGAASNFREMLVQLWRRWFKKAVEHSTGVGAATIKTYADNDTSVITTQVVSDDGTDQTQGKAT
jgi:hypothetical protein